MCHLKFAPDLIRGTISNSPADAREQMTKEPGLKLKEEVCLEQGRHCGGGSPLATWPAQGATWGSEESWLGSRPAASPSVGPSYKSCATF